MPGGGGAQPDANARAAGYGPHHAGERDRAVHPAQMLVAGAEIVKLYRIALRVGLAGHEHGGVADIMLLDPDAVFQFYGPEAPRIRFIPGGIVQQGREYRIAVDAGRSAERRVGKEGGRTCWSRWASYDCKKNQMRQATGRQKGRT